MKIVTFNKAIVNLCEQQSAQLKKQKLDEYA